MTEEKKTRKLTVQMFLVLLLCAALAVGCLLVLYEYRFSVYNWALRNNLVTDNRDDYIRWVSEEAPKYELEPTGHVDEADREMIDQEYLSFLFKNRDPYVGFAIYNDETGKYVTGYRPEIISDSYWGSWFFADTPMVANQGEQVEVKIRFKDYPATLIVDSYRIIKIFPMYLGLGILVCLTIFLTPVLVFIHRRMKYLGTVRSEVLVMAQGDLGHPMSVVGKDEITSLAQELDYLRQALKENIEKERQSHRANQELIRAMSHDLRTPLTTLYGYLEILNHSKGNPERYPEYVRRCLAKTEEIRGMSDKMFEYALVFDNQDEVDRQELPLEIIWTELTEAADYLQSQGFFVEMKGDCVEGQFLGNAFLMKRLLGNLISNIQRYGEKSVPVELILENEPARIKLTLNNRVRGETSAMGSGVGLKSAERIALLHGGRLTWEEREGVFQAALVLPVVSCGVPEVPAR